VLQSRVVAGRALLLGVRRFTDRASAELESPLEHRNWAPLPFVDEVLAQVRDGLRRLDFRVEVRLDLDRDRMVDSVRAALEDDSGTLVLHVVSHGEVGVDDTRLDVVPACGRTGLGTNIGEWVSAAQQREHPVLLLLDLCRSGRMARLPWQLRLTGLGTTTWVIAAAGPDEDAFDGRFSRAVAEVLDRLAGDGLGADPSTPYVPLGIVARRIGVRVAAYGGLPQQVYSSPVDPAQPGDEPPFFPNPRYAPDRVASRALDPPLREFLDHAYFLDRAGTHFTGRHRELRQLSLWLDGAASDRPVVVTGSPGAGKSALLGVLVSAAHPSLAEEVPAVRARLDVRSCPSLNHNLAAVNARGRDALQLVHSIADQLDLPAPWRGRTPELMDVFLEVHNGRWTLEDYRAAARQPGQPGWNATTFVEVVTELSDSPVIVVDALDEALDPIALVNELLLPLVRARRPTGERVCRLLVATRREAKFDRVLAEAEVFDLDVVEVDVLRADLEHHLTDRLADASRYRERSVRLVRERLAWAVADRLARASRDWGAFLLAEIFLRYLDAVPVPPDIAAAERLGASVPTGLPEVFELHLGALSPDRTLRWALAAIAFGKGEGVPAEVVATLVGAHVADVLVQGGPYLRTSVDCDGTTLYRLFHYSLSEYLRSQHDAGRLYERLAAGVHSWRAAAPYLLRHAIEHAADAGRVDDLLADPEFLVMADPDTLVGYLGLARSPTAREMAAVYRMSARRHRAATPDERREVLAIDACRNGSTALVRTFAGAGLVPRWATGALVHPALRDVLSDDGVSVLSVDCLRIGDEPVAATADSRTIRLWDLRRGRPWQPARIILDQRCDEAAAFVADGRPVAAALDIERGIWLVDLITGERIGVEIVSPDGYSYFAVTAGEEHGRAVVVAGGFGDEVQVWPVPSDECTEPHGIGYHGESIDFANSFTANGTTVVVTGDKRGRINARTLSDHSVDAELVGHKGSVRGAAGVAHGADLYAVSTADDGTVRAWKLKSDRPRGKTLTRDDGTVGPVACTVVDDRPIALVGHGDEIRVWDLRTRERIGDPLPHTGLVSDIECTDIDGRPVAVSTAHDGSVRVWNLDVALVGGAAARPGHTESINAAACAVVGGRMVVVAGGGMDDTRQDGVGVWDLADGTPVGGWVDDEYGWVVAVATVVVGDTAVAVLATSTGYSNSLRLWDIATGTPFGKPLEGHNSAIDDVAAATVGGRPLVIAGGTDGTARVWDLTDGTCITLRAAEPSGPVESVTIGDNRGTPYAATCSEHDRKFVIWDVMARVERCRVDAGFRAWRVVCTTMAGHLVVVAAGEGVGVFDARTGTHLRTMASAPGWYVRHLSCGVSGGQTVAVTGCSDDVVRLWDLATGVCLETHAVPDMLEAVAIAPDGGIVVCYDREIVVLDRNEAR
jgi:WD40 repeat protein